MEDYRIQLMATNISPFVQQYMALRVAAQMETTLLCSLSREYIIIPIRHKGFINIKCIFEFQVWLEYYQSTNSQNFNQCPGCRANVRFSDYGVDYALLNAIAMLRYIDPQGNRFFKDKLVTIYSQHQFYGISKKDPKIKIILPGCSAILNVQRRQQQSAKVQLDKNNRNTYEEISQTMEKFEQYLKQKKFRAIYNHQMNLNHVIQKLESKATAVKQAILKNCQFVEIGRQSITPNDFVFALKKSKSEQGASSILVVYYPHYHIWLDFELFYSNGQPYLQQEQALYIKNSKQADFNIIYILGGKTEQFEQSAQFLKIEIPKDPYTQINQLTLIKLPDLLQTGYNYLGTFYEDQIFIFYGQQRYVNKSNCITDSMLNVAQVYNNNTWSKLDIKPIPRFDGSYFAINHEKYGKCIVFYGGVPDQPDGLPNSACKSQNKGQIFVCQNKTFFGGVDRTFDLKFPKIAPGSKQDRIICSPIFSIPYYGKKQLLISGNYLKQNLKEKRQIYTFDWGEGNVELNEIFSLEPPEQLLTPYQNRLHTGLEIFTPVQDCEGCLIYGNFYTVHQFEEQGVGRQKISITQLLKINLTNGLFTIFDYQDKVNTQEKNRARILNLKQQKNVVMNINI